MFYSGKQKRVLGAWRNVEGKGNLSMMIKMKYGSLLVRGLLLVVFLVAVTLFINLSWFDEPLHPDLVSLSSPRPVSMDDNSFPLLHGFSASADKNSLDVGLAIVRNLRERYQQGRKITLSDEEMHNLIGGSDLDQPWRSKFQTLACNSRPSVDCAGRLIAEIEQVDLDQPRLKLLLARYAEILQASRFEENEEFDAYTPLPWYGLAMQIARVRLAISFQRDTTEDFLARVEEDIDFWRMVLRDGQSLIAKMVALAAFRNDLEYISALIRLRDLSNNELESIRDLLHPLTRGEQDIGESFLSELRVTMLSDPSLIVMLSDYSWVTRVFFQEQATLNEYYLTAVMPMRVRASLDAEAFYGQQGYEKLPYSIRVFPPPLYNLGGKLALKQLAAKHSVQDYISRVHDVNGRVSLVFLQAEIEQNPELSVASIVSSSTYRNPYTGEPMEHDVSSGTIGFECLTKIPTDVCSVSVGELAR